MCLNRTILIIIKTSCILNVMKLMIIRSLDIYVPKYFLDFVNPSLGFQLKVLAFINC